MNSMMIIHVYHYQCHKMGCKIQILISYRCVNLQILCWLLLKCSDLADCLCLYRACLNKFCYCSVYIWLEGIESIRIVFLCHGHACWPNTFAFSLYNIYAVFNLTNNVDLENTKKKMELYQKDNKEVIQKNKLKLVS